MKKRLIFFLLISICSSFSYSQGSMKVYLKNSTTLSGLGTIQIKKVKIKDENQKGSEKIKFKEIDSLEIYTKEGWQTLYFFESKDVSDRAYDYFFLEKKGKLSLYSKSYSSLTGYGVFENTSYCIKRDNESGVHNLAIGGLFKGTFIKKASEYFKDCPELVDKINKSVQGFENKEKNLKNIVRFYNTKCN